MLMFTAILSLFKGMTLAKVHFYSCCSNLLCVVCLYRFDSIDCKGVDYGVVNKHRRRSSSLFKSLPIKLFLLSAFVPFCKDILQATARVLCF